MRNVPKTFMPLALLLAAASPAPRLVPTRDVTVSYEVRPHGHAPIAIRVAIAAGGARLRIIGDDLPTSFVVDRDSETAAIVLPMLKTYTRVSIARYDPAQTVLHGAAFTRGGRDLVAGLACTRWQAHAPKGNADACITDDGVILDGRVASFGEVRALRVEYGPLSEKIFTVPSNYTESQLGQAAANFSK
jgi:hypothetical protein